MEAADEASAIADALANASPEEQRRARAAAIVESLFNESDRFGPVAFKRCDDCKKDEWVLASFEKKVWNRMGAAHQGCRTEAVGNFVRSNQSYCRACWNGYVGDPSEEKMLDVWETRLSLNPSPLENCETWEGQWMEKQNKDSWALGGFNSGMVKPSKDIFLQVPLKEKIAGVERARERKKEEDQRSSSSKAWPNLKHGGSWGSGGSPGTGGSWGSGGARRSR